MACQTCDHTMQSVSDGVWWCPRCGSLKMGDLHFDIPTWHQRQWVTDLDLVDEDIDYLVLAIGQRSDGSTYVYDPHVLRGREFKRRPSGCYAGIPMPDWGGS